jgi:mono/diheme cytochrome c family protein
MKRILKRVVPMAIAPLLMAAIWMDKQPSYKAYEAPVLAPPATAVPVSGKEIISPQSELKNPVSPGKESLAQGEILFDINCAMCHGQTSVERGPVGKKLSPPPPGLDHEMVRSLSDSDIFKAITFGFGRMPPFQNKLITQERWSLVNFLRTRK